MRVPEFPAPVLESLSNVLGDTSTGLTGTEIGRYLGQCGIEDPMPGFTKRVRLYGSDKHAMDAATISSHLFKLH